MRSRRISIEITDPLLSILEKAEEGLHHQGEDSNLSEYILACLSSLHEDDMLPFPEGVNTVELSDIMQEEAQRINNEAKLEKERGFLFKSRANFLKSASLELESMSLVPNLGDREEISRVISVLLSIKLALGYKSLPTV